MALVIHHLDCATMCPWPGAWINDGRSFGERGYMPAHCLLIETPTSGLVLVDTGLGTEDMRHPLSRLGAPYTWLVAPKLDPQIPALAQVKKLGFDPKDVRHMVLTHLDLDHAGGLPDFPWARVHVHHVEKDAAMAPSRRERERYRPAHFAHHPDFVTFDRSGEPWNGFLAARDLPGLPPEILAVPLPGHTRGHACIAVDRGDRWLFHAGDAYFHPRRLEGKRAPAALQVFERVVAMDYERVLDNHRRLGELAQRSDVTVFSAHDAGELEALRAKRA